MNAAKIENFVRILSKFKKDGEDGHDANVDDDCVAGMDWVIDEARGVLKDEDRLVLDMSESSGCVVWFEGAKTAQNLMCCEANGFYAAGGVDAADEQLLTCDLTAPEDQAFLDRINEAYGTDLRFDQFAGR
jgi:hypothetical protein